MQPFSVLHRVTARQLLGHPNFLPPEWSHLAKRAYCAPIAIEDGFHRYVLMSEPDYEEFQASAELLDGFSEADQQTIARFLLAMKVRAERAAAGEEIAEGAVTSGAAILHPDETVIPLSRGRSIPVDTSGA
jgi:hypothetical protein